MQAERRDGTAAVVGGVLVVTPPAPGGRPARVRGEAGVELVRTGASEPVDELELVAAGEVEVRLPDVAPRADVEVEVSPDALSATIRVDRVPGARYRLEDQPPNRDVVLRRLVHERIPCPPPTAQALRATLVRNGVVSGILSDSLERLVRGSNTEVVARGEAARPARDGRIVLHAAGDGSGLPPYVRAGALLAEIQEGVRGEMGCDVHGSPLPAGSAEAVAVEVGEGARLADGGRIVAVVAGHAAMEDGAIVVRDPLVLPADAADRISTPGSLELTGDVPDLAIVRARGDVLVAGSVRRATVEAGGSLVVLGPIADASLRAGHLQVAGTDAAPALAAVAAELQRLEAGVAQVLAACHGAGRALPPARAVGLAEGRVAPDLDEHVRGVFAALEREHGTVPAETLTRLRDAVASLVDVRMGRRPVSTLASLARAFAEEGATLAAIGEPPLLAVPFAERSRLEVQGELRLTGRGTIDSTLHVTGLLDADDEDVAIRGGEVFVDGEARIAEASVRGRPLRIVLAPGARLHVRLAHAGVVVDVAGTEHRVTALTRGLALHAPLADAA